MRDVEAAVPRRHARQLDELGRRCVAADLVLESRRQSDRSVGERLLDQRLHPRNLGCRGLATEVVAHHGPPDGRVSDEQRDVHRGRRRSPSSQVVADGQRRAAILTQQDRRNSLGHLRASLGIRIQSVGRMVVRIDEAGREHQASPVDDAIFRPRNRRTYLTDRIAREPHVHALKRGAGAVGHTGAGNRPARWLSDAGAALLVRRGLDDGVNSIDLPREAHEDQGDGEQRSGCGPHTGILRRLRAFIDHLAKHAPLRYHQRHAQLHLVRPDGDRRSSSRPSTAPRTR